MGKVSGRKKVISIDAAGQDNIVSLCILYYIEKRLNKPVSEIFDFAAGVSSSGYIFAALSILENESKNYTSKDVINLLIESIKVFEPENQPYFQKYSSLFGVLSERYSNEYVNNVISKTFGDARLSSSKMNIEILSYAHCKGSTYAKPYIWSSYLSKKQVNYDYYVKDAVIATQSLPGAFAAHQVTIDGNECLHLDGGVVSISPLLPVISNIMDYANLEFSDFDVLSIKTKYVTNDEEDFKKIFTNTGIYSLMLSNVGLTDHMVAANQKILDDISSKVFENYHSIEAEVVSPYYIVSREELGHECVKKFLVKQGIHYIQKNHHIIDGIIYEFFGEVEKNEALERFEKDLNSIVQGDCKKDELFGDMHVEL